MYVFLGSVGRRMEIVSFAPYLTHSEEYTYFHPFFFLPLPIRRGHILLCSACLIPGTLFRLHVIESSRSWKGHLLCLLHFLGDLRTEPFYACYACAQKTSACTDLLQQLALLLYSLSLILSQSLAAFGRPHKSSPVIFHFHPAASASSPFLYGFPAGPT